MGLATTLARRRAPASPQLRTAGDTLEGVLLDFSNRYGFLPWQAATYRGFMAVPGAWRASVMLSDLFAQMPFHSYRRGPSGGDVATPRNAAILEEPAGTHEDPLTVYASWAMDYLWDGNAVGVYTARGANGLPVAVLPVPVCDVGVRMQIEPGSRNGRLGEYTGRREYSIGGVIFDQSEIFHIKGPCAPAALRGLGVLETQLAALTLARDLQAQADAIGLHGVPTGLLKSTNPEADPADLTLAKAAWISSQRTRTVAALGPNIDFEPLAWNPEDMQLVEARKMSLTEMELAFGLPVGWLGGSTSNRTYSNVEQDAVNLIKFSMIAGMIAKFESKLTRQWLPRGQTARANRDAVLRSDTMTRYSAHAIALGKKPFKTVNEVRGTENLAPLPGGDELDLTPVEPPAAPDTTEPTDDNGTTTDENSPEGGDQQ